MGNHAVLDFLSRNMPYRINVATTVYCVLKSQ